jgi:hypothetical protein
MHRGHVRRAPPPRPLARGSAGGPRRLRSDGANLRSLIQAAEEIVAGSRSSSHEQAGVKLSELRWCPGVATLGAVRAKTASLLPTAATNRTFVSCQRLAKA